MTDLATTPVPGTATVACACIKGGVGKSSTTAALADALVRLGFKVLLIDLDSRSDLSAHTGVTVNLVDGPPTALGGASPKVPDRLTVLDVIASGAPGVASQAAQAAEWNGAWEYPAAAPFSKGGPLPGESLGVVAIIPSYDRLEAASQAWTPGDLTRLRTTLHDPDPETGVAPVDEWDVILIDTPPAPGMLTRQAYRAVDNVLVVTQPAANAISGAEDTINLVNNMRTDWNHPGLNLVGVVLNEYQERLSDHRFNADELTAVLNATDGGAESLLWDPPVPARTVVAQAQSARLPVSAFLADSAQAAAALAVCRSVEAHALTLVERLGLPRAATARKKWNQVVAAHTVDTAKEGA